MSSLSTRPLRVGELARRTGKTARALRFYEELGLLSPSGRTPGGFRLYDADAMLRIEWIDRLQELGFPLADIRDFLDRLNEHNHGPSAMADLQDFYREKLSETRAAVQRFLALQAELEASVHYLSVCRSCESDTPRTACQSCDSDVPDRGEVPGLVAAVQ